ncbi:MAG: alpha/beta hydrolase [Polaromonas sp.]|nr:alpha/beta hydrolase [Polaromonas sp.]MBK9339948.1 alpha/beta hydrolase [Rhodoferax sp.]
MKNILRSVIAALFVTLTLGALLGTQAFAQKTEEIVRLKTRNNVEQPYWLIRQNAPVKVVAVLFTGGFGLLKLRATDAGVAWSETGTSYLVLNKDLFIDNETAVAIVDVPSDESSIGYTPKLRKSDAHMQDVGFIVKDLRARFPQAKLFLVGTSQGATSAAYAGKALGKEIDGVVLTASVFDWAPAAWRLLSDSNLSDFDLSKIAAPLLIVHHVDDKCVATTYAGAIKVAGKFPFIAVHGGTPVQDNGCGPKGPHGFLGREDAVATEIKNWMHARPYKTEIR